MPPVLHKRLGVVEVEWSGRSFESRIKPDGSKLVSAGCLATAIFVWFTPLGFPGQLNARWTRNVCLVPQQLWRWKTLFLHKLVNVTKFISALA